MALGKLYSSRSQRGGLRLHRSLLLTLVMKSARDIYHAAQATAENVAPECELQHPADEVIAEPAGAQGLQSPASPPAEEPRSTSSSTELRRTHTRAENKENVCPSGPVQHSRKRRSKTAAEPDFLPCKKAKLEQGNCPQQLIVSSVLSDYVTCSSELRTAPTPIPVHTAIAAC